MMPDRKKSPTMKDVAREAGVALGTVSKAINGLPVGQEYKNRVDRAVEKLHYHVNPFAKSLKSSKTFTVALIIPNIYNSFFAELAHCVNKTLADRQYHMLLCTTDNAPGTEQEFINSLQQNQADGIIVLSYASLLNFSGNLPVVSIDRRFRAGIPCVCSDNFRGGQMAAERLLAKDCRNLAYISLMTDVQTEVARRKEGFISACLAGGCRHTEAEFVGTEDFSLIRGFLDKHIKNGHLEFDGLFCVSDSMAYQTIHFLEMQGICVPKDVQVIGYDGIRKFGFLDLFCSTIRQPVPKIAETCVNLLLNEQDRELAPSLINLPVTYEPGGTTRE